MSILDQILCFSLTTLESIWCGKVNSAERRYKYIYVKMSYINANVEIEHRANHQCVCSLLFFSSSAFLSFFQIDRK